MAESLSTIRFEPQLDFPNVDLTDANANQLELLLANKKLVEEGRQEAERAGQTQYSFNVHFGFRTIQWPIFRYKGSKGAFRHGMSAYQTMGQELRPFPDYDDPRVWQRVEEIRDLSIKQLEQFQDTAWLDMAGRQPRAGEVIRTASERFFPGLGEFALYGAAVTRLLEVEATELPQPQPQSWLESVLK